METQRERQKGLTCQVFEQDTSGDERMGSEDTVRGRWLGLLRVWTQENALLASILMSEIDPRTESHDSAHLSSTCCLYTKGLPLVSVHPVTRVTTLIPLHGQRD